MDHLPDGFKALIHYVIDFITAFASLLTALVGVHTVFISIGKLINARKRKKKRKNRDDEGTNPEREYF